jgi:hypothetical protein
MERRHQIGLDSYDRFFPNQDTMPKGGFGNLIALPLQKAIRDEGKSVFLDESLEPFADQWAHLSSIQRFTYAEAEGVVNDAQLKGDLVGVRISLAEDDEEPDPWTLPHSRKRSERLVPGPFPRSVKIVRANLVFIPKAGLAPAMLNILLRVAAFQNPEFYKAQSMRLSTYDKPRVIACGDDLANHVALPRGSLNATPARKDGHHPIIFMQCGPIRYRMSARTMTENTPFEHVEVPRGTDFRMSGEEKEITIQDVYADLVNDAGRNDLIAGDLLREVRSGRSPLLLTGRTEHLSVFDGKLNGLVKNVFVLKGGMGRKQRREIALRLAAVPPEEQRVILATGSYIGEGFDDARLDTLFLAMPISWKGTLQQYVGRLHRLHDNKRVVRVYDYIDGSLRMLNRMYKRRLSGYADMGYTVLGTSSVQRDLSLYPLFGGHAFKLSDSLRRSRSRDPCSRRRRMDGKNSF